ncbi:MAG: DUF3488 and DUF4129 domain-containing transglutaminase family protein [Caldilineaceae bacterium]
MSANATGRITPRALYRDNFYFRDGTALTAILVALIYLVLAISLDAAGYVRNLSVLVPVTLGSFGLGFLMSMSRFDGFFALLHSMFVGLAWILILMSRSVSKVEIAPILSNGYPETQASAYFLMAQWSKWVIAFINNDLSADNYVFIFEMCFLVWWLTYLGVWSIFRYGYVWRAVIPAGAVLLINAYYAPESILVFLVIFLFLALLLLVRTNLSEQQLRWRELRVQFNQDIALDFLRNGLFYSVVVLVLALVVPGLNRSAQVRAALAPVNQQWEETTERVNRLYQGLNRQTSPAVSTFGNTLTLSGARNVTDDVIFRVQTPIGRYWRAVVYDTFTGETWLTTATEDKTFDAQENVPIAAFAMRRPITQTITLDSPVGYVLFGAPDILRVDLPMEATLRSIQTMNAPTTNEAPGTVEISMAQSRRLLDPGDSYTVVSMNTNVTEAALRAASTDYPQDILDRYLQIPDGFSERVAQDARDLTATQTTVYDKAKAVEAFLRTYQYNDAIEAPPAGRDPIEYFLYDIREGYCDYYATAMVLMLRSVGVPSRVASGYAEGFYNDDTYEYQVTARDAHTWVEVFFPEYGWIEFEPTAGESQLNRPRGLEDAENPFASSAADSANSAYPGPLGEQEQFDQGLDPNAFGEDFNLGARSETLGDRAWWLLGLLVSLGLAIGLVFIWRTRYAGPTAFDPELPPLLYERLERWSHRLGLSSTISFTPYENARRLGRRVPEGRVPIDTITESYVQYSFGGKRAGDNGLAHDAWRHLRPQLWRSWFASKFQRKPQATGNEYRLVNGDTKSSK